MVTRTDTHDMGFIVMPSLRMDWELTGNKASLDAIVTAARSLASRFDSSTGAVRSWDRMKSHRYHVEDNDNNFLVIIDSMCSKLAAYSYVSPMSRGATMLTREQQIWIYCSMPGIMQKIKTSSILPPLMLTRFFVLLYAPTGQHSMFAT
jgi:hypothetical protein